MQAKIQIGMNASEIFLCSHDKVYKPNKVKKLKKVALETSDD